MKDCLTNLPQIMFFKTIFLTMIQFKFAFVLGPI